MHPPVHRRTFLGAAAAASISPFASADAPVAAASKINVGIMGVGGRGNELLRDFSAHPGVTVTHLCDVDAERLNKGNAALEKVSGKPAKLEGDFRRLLDDKSIDVFVVATCNHWHAPAAILGCSAGKHVYVEKPCSYDPQEGEWLVQAARKNKRLVQMGNQRRSWEKIIEAVNLVREGIIGRAYKAVGTYVNNRPSIQVGKLAPVPAGLDYAMWQGPAPAKPFKDNYLHYTWHWFWHWGNGELGNNGIHTIDVCRWGLGVDYPTRVVASGGRYRYQDDQETPDTSNAAFEFADRKTITWDGYSCNIPTGGKVPEIVFYGEKGSLAISGNGYVISDVKGVPQPIVPIKNTVTPHTGNLLAAIRDGVKLNSEIEEGHKSTLLCHLGNISYRTGRALKIDPTNGHILGDADAMKLWSREYTKAWEPKV